MAVTGGPDILIFIRSKIVVTVAQLFTLIFYRVCSYPSVERLHGREQKTGALYPPASSHIFSIARKLGHNVLILFHNIPSSLPQLV